MQDLLEFLASPAVAVPLALLGFGVLVTAYACGALKCGKSASYGSGVNPIWNSFIDDNPPLPNSKKLRMAHGWEFKGSHGKPGTVDCPGEDGLTGGELTGHLIGRQVWVPTGQAADASPPYEPFDASSNQNSGDKILRAQMLEGSGLDVEAPQRGARGSLSVDDAISSALDFYAHLQSDDGHWAGDYGGPFFLLPGLVMVCHITGVQLSAAHVDGMLTYMKNHQQEDGGWGLHMEGPSTMFGTVMQYVACRTLGMAAESVEMAAARAFIHKHGGATTAPSWCKFWLCVFGVYEWQGLNSIPPELWLLPRWSPFHPWRMWCHARMVYLPMSYLYGARAAAPEGPLQVALKKELYPVEYAAVDWDAARNTICPRDLYSPHTKIMDAAFEVLKYYERAPLQMLREPALRFAAQYCHEEDKQTNFVDIGPVNKVMNMLVAYHEFGRDSPEFSKHVARIWDYLWVAEDGVKMQGYNGSQLWDTGFAIQAMEATGMAERVSDTLARAYSFFDATQSKEDVPNREAFFRIISKGGWPFSTNDHGWPIADCTSEGLKGVMAIHRMGTAVARIPPARMFDAVNLVLEFQNPDGGWATYERNRGYNWFEWLNPAEVFGDIMIDYTYTELTSACVTALTQFQGQHPSHRTAEITAAIQRGVDFVRLQQRPDGSFYGSWGVCFTYGTWFGVEAMVAAGDPSGEDAPALAKACDFLVSKQNPDGGWGESYLSCVRKTYVSRESTAFNTAWALLGLIKAQTSHVEAVEAGVRFLMRLQRTSGDWPQQSVAGVFNRTCGITYTSYRNVFPIWALGAYRTEYHHKKDTTVPVPLAE